MLRSNYLAVMCLGLMMACGPGAPGEGESGIEGPVGQVRSAIVSFSPASLDFPVDQKRGTTSATKQVTISNLTTTPQSCTVTAPAPFFLVNPNDATDYFSTLTVSVPARSNSSTPTVRSRNVVFRPTTVGTFGGQGAAALTLTITCTSGNSSVSLTGASLSSAAVSLPIPPAGLTFGLQKVGTSSLVQAVTVSNSSTAFNITSITVPAGFQVTAPTPVPTNGANPVQVSGATTVNGTRNISVVFSPTEVGTPSGNLTITTDEPSTLTVPLSGTAVALATQVSPRSPLTFPLDFGDLRTGTQSEPKGVIIYNAGDSALDLSGITITSPFTFELAAPQLTSLPRGQSQELLVKFSPASNHLEDQTGWLSITTNEQKPDAPVGEVVSIPVELWGRGIAPNLERSPTAGFVFGDQRVSISRTEMVTVTNNGNGPLDITAIAVAQTAPTSGTPAFTFVSSDLPLSGRLAAGASVELEVSFNPSAEGDYAGTLNLVTTDHVLGTVRIPLGGKGVKPELQMNPTAGFVFGNQRVGTSVTKLVTVTNNGNSPLDITGITVAQTAPTGGTPAFTFVSSDLPASGRLAAGASVELRVSFNPNVDVDHTGNLNLATTDLVLGTVPIPLTGKGVKPRLQMLPVAGFVFSDQRVGISRTELVTVTNNGNGPLDITGITVAQTAPTSGTSAFTFVSSNLPTSGRLAAGASVELRVSFNPSAEVDYTGDLNLATTDPELGTVRIPLGGKGVKPLLQMGPTSEFAFGDQRVNTTSATKLVTVTNNGTGPLDISSAISISQTAPTSGTVAFTLVSSSLATPGRLAAGASVELRVSFNPTAEADYTGTLNLATTDPELGTVRIPLTGKGVKPRLQMLPAAEFAFGEQRVNTTSVTKLVTVTNNGTGPLDINSAISITQTAPTSGTAAFTLVSSSLATPGRLAVGARVELEVSFRPSAEGDYTGTVNLATTDPELGTVRLPLTGKGVKPRLQMLPTAEFAFGEQRVETSVTKLVTVTNNGTGPLDISSAISVTQTAPTSATPAFTLVSSSLATPGRLAAGASVELRVRFNPSAEADYTGTVNLATTDPELGTVRIPLSGMGVKPRLQMLPAAEFAFDEQRVNTTSVTKLVTVTNNGTGPLDISSAISVTQTAPSSGTQAFTLVSSSLATPGRLAAGASVQLRVSFNPTAEVNYTGTVNLVTTDPELGTVRIPLTGKGVKPRLQMLPTDFAFGNQRVGISVTKLVTVTNNGTGPLDITGITRNQTAPTSGDQAFTLVSSSVATPGKLAVGASMELRVSFLPSAEADYTGTLNLATTDPELGTVRISLSGRGALPQLVPNQNPLDFGTLRVGTIVSKKVMVTNTGLSPILITGIVKLGSEAFAHTASSRTLPTMLEPSGSIELTVTFSPNDVNPAYSGSLTLTTDDPDLKSVAIGLVGGAGVPQLEVTPNPVGFGDQRVDTSATRAVRVRNTGTGPIEITSISTPSSPFSITSPSNLTISRTLAAGAHLDISVQFLPKAEGSFSGSFNLTTDSTEIPGVTVSLSGKGVMPNLELTPSPLVFSDQLVGSASAPVRLQVRNTGTGPVSISNVLISGSTPAFTLTTTTVTKFDLQPNGTHDLWVVFNPGTKATHTASLTLQTDVMPPSVTLEGTGISRLVLDPAETVNFGAVNLRNSNKTVTRAVKLTNSSGAPIELKSISPLTGYPFVVRNLSPRVIAPNEVIIFNVDFTAPSEGDFSAILSLETDASNGPSHHLVLEGKGALPAGKLILPNGVEIASLDFGGVQAETTKQITARFANVGLVPLIVGTPTMGKSDRVFTYLGPDTLTLQPGTHMDFQVTFRPPALQSYSDTLTIPSDAKFSPTTLSLLGAGAVPQVKLDRQSIFFGDVRVGSSSTPVAVTINNTGNADVVVQGLSVVGPFAVVLPTGIKLPTTIKAFNSLSFDVVFNPWEPTPVVDGGQAATTGSVTVITDISGATLEPVTLSGIGTISVAHLPTTELAFGNQRVRNASGAQPVLIHNKGAAQLEISDLIFSNSVFVLSSPTSTPTAANPMRIPAGQQGVVSVKFNPDTLGAVSGKLYIISNAFTPASEVTLSGTGVDGRISMDPSVVTFSNVDVGGAGAQTPVTLTNSGEYPLKISTVGTPTDSSFSVMGLPPNLVLEKKQTWSFTVSFNPAKRGYFAANAIITSDSVLNPSFSMAMEGTGVSAAAELQPKDVNFGSANLNVSTPYDISIKNDGEKDLLVSKVSFVDDPAFPGAALDFSVDSGVAFPLTVKAGQSNLVRLRFTPRVIGTRRATVVVFTSVPNGGERRASLLGEGNSSQMGVTSTGLPFGDVLMNSPSEPATIRIKNNGTGSLTVRSINLAGPDMAFFTLVKPEALPVLAAGASVSVSVTLTPPEERTFLAQLLVSTDNADAPNASVELRGSGVRSQIQVEPNPLSFGNQLVYGTSKQRPVTITNNRRDLVSIRSITTEGPFDFVLPTGVRLPYTLEGKLAGEETGKNKLDVGVRIKPQAEGAVTGKLRISFTDQVLQPLEVELRGTGIPSALSITPVELDFGAIRAGGSAQPLTFAINNLIDDEIELGKPVSLNTNTGEPFDYNWALLEGTKIGARSPFTVQVGYKPLVETLSDTTLNFGTRLPEWRGSATLQLKGRAVARLLRVEPDDLDFGRVDVGKPMVTKEITITNLSAQSQRVEAKLSTEVASFVLTTKTLADPIPPGGSAKITLGFKPENAGMVENELRISLQGDSVAEAVIAVHGNGRDLSVSQPGCSTSTTETGTAGLLALLALVGLGSRRRRRG